MRPPLNLGEARKLHQSVPGWKMAPSFCGFGDAETPDLVLESLPIVA
jgi:hypothetical protein